MNERKLNPIQERVLAKLRGLLRLLAVLGLDKSEQMEAVGEMSDVCEDALVDLAEEEDPLLAAAYLDGTAPPAPQPLVTPPPPMPPTIPLFCTYCALPHYDHDYAAKLPHREHVCEWCGRTFEVWPLAFGAQPAGEQATFTGYATVHTTNGIPEEISEIATAVQAFGALFKTLGGARLEINILDAVPPLAAKDGMQACCRDARVLEVRLYAPRAQLTPKAMAALQDKVERIKSLERKAARPTRGDLH